MAGYFASDVTRELRVLAAERDCTIQALLTEALNDLFAKHGRGRPIDEEPLPRGGAAVRARRNSR